MNEIESLVSNRVQIRNLNKLMEVVHYILDADIQSLDNGNITTIRKQFPDISGEIGKINLSLVYRYMVNAGYIAQQVKHLALFRKKNMRSQSGVVVIATMTSSYPEGKPMSCQYNCIGCPDPSLPDLDANYQIIDSEDEPPRSYPPTGPCTSRARRHQFDPVAQFMDRAHSYVNMGHTIDKVEYKVLGGTISNYSRTYLKDFFRDSYYAANNFHKLLVGLQPERLSLQEEIGNNEKAKCRIIGMTVETRPDHISPAEIKWFIENAGTTRFELGIQHTDDALLERFNRMATDRHSHVAMFYLYACGLKSVIHLMPDLPQILNHRGKDRIQRLVGQIPYPKNSREYRLDFREILNTVDPDHEIDNSVPVWRKDLDMFQKIVDRNWGDEWKIYPHEAVSYTPVPKWVQRGIYKPYFDQLVLTDDEIKWYDKQITNHNRLSVREKRKLDIFRQQHNRLYTMLRDEIAPIIPEYVRVDRLGRDIPGGDIKGGMNATNIRQYIEQDLTRRGQILGDIRSREVKSGQFHPDSVHLVQIPYTVQGDHPEFTFEIPQMYLELRAKLFETDKEVLIGYLRLGFPSTCGPEFAQRQVYKTFPELKGALMIRQLEVLGSMTPVGLNTGGAQHRGYGKMLVKRAEEIALERGFHKMAVISGVGVRNYYRKLGYQLEGCYMTKIIPNGNTILYMPLGCSYICLIVVLLAVILSSIKYLNI